jgi:hypothetical protein
MGMGFQVIVLGVLADLVGVNRKLLEKLNWRSQKLEGAQISVSETAKRGDGKHQAGIRTG